jgi:hypothetical protein
MNTYTLLLTAVSVLATVVAYLFRANQKMVKDASKERREHDAALADKDRVFAKEREAWMVERVQWEHDRELDRANDERSFEQRYRELVQRQESDLAHDRALARAYVDQVRKECADQVELIAQKMQEASERTAQVLDKIYDRFLSGPRRRNF